MRFDLRFDIASISAMSIFSRFSFRLACNMRPYTSLSSHGLQYGHQSVWHCSNFSNSGSVSDKFRRNERERIFLRPRTTRVFLLFFLLFKQKERERKREVICYSDKHVVSFTYHTHYRLLCNLRLKDKLVKAKLYLAIPEAKRWLCVVPSTITRTKNMPRENLGTLLGRGRFAKGRKE